MKKNTAEPSPNNTVTAQAKACENPATSPDKPLILAVETSGRYGSVALGAGSELLAERSFTGQMRHSAELFGAIRHLLSDFGRRPCDIEHVYISIGPGSFTGLRLSLIHI